ncbi:MAG TPA: hypothetical protein VJ736_00625 [Actinomycetota bacterium]|jgi:hypothetical protein|nr:hypothetical protein [Actinomycetota bacterium]
MPARAVGGIRFLYVKLTQEIPRWRHDLGRGRGREGEVLELTETHREEGFPDWGTAR